MELKGFLEATLNDMEGRLTTTLDGLTAPELSWRPDPQCHSIGFALWHIYRVEDYWLQRFIQRGAELYESEGWQEKLGTPPKEMGYQYTVEQVAGFKVPALDTIQAYGKSVRRHTLEFLTQLPVERMDEKPREDRSPQSIGDVFQRLIIELSLHMGQMAYLRGMQRGLDK